MMTAPVQTLGPADSKAPGFAKAYTVLAALLSLAATAGAFGLLTEDQAASIKELGYQLGLSMGAAVSTIAAFRTHKQVRNGTFDAAPKPEPAPPAPPAMTAVEQVKAVQDSFTDFTKAIADGVQLVQGVAVPGLSTAVENGSLVDQFLSGHKAQ